MKACAMKSKAVKREKKVDSFIELLQKLFAKTVIWGNVGGYTGERMVRAAFAPMIKFSNLTVDFKALSEEYQIEQELNADITDSKERDLKIVHQLKTNPKFDQIQKRWAAASRMRTFYQEIKKSISEAIEKKKQKNLLMKGDSEREEPSVDESASVMIDTSTHNSGIEMSFDRTQSAIENEKLERDIENITIRISKFSNSSVA